MSRLRLWLCCVAVAFVGLSLAGVTNSSLAIADLSVTARRDAPGVVVGTPRLVRTDEYLRRTPWLLGLMARGDDGFLSPLAFPEVALVAPTARDVPSSLLHWDALAAKAAPVLPDAMLFAAIWWFPVAVVAALLPLWLLRLGVRPGIAVATTSLVLLAPINHWWSWVPMVVLAPPLLAALLGLAALDRLRARGPNLLSLGAFMLAVLCVAKVGLGYAPWTIPLAAAVFAPTLGAALSTGGRRLTLICLGAVFAAGVALFALFVTQSGALDVVADTVYPGSRRSSGEYVGLGLLLGTPHLWALELGTVIGRGTNESRLSSGYLVLAVPSIVLALTVRWRGLAVAVPTGAAASVLLVCLSWVVVDWPAAIGNRLAPLTLIPPERMAQAVGLVATIVFGLVLSAWADAPRRDRRPVAATAFALTALATMLGGASLRDEALPRLPWPAILVVALVVALAVAAAIWRPDRSWALAALPVVALVVVLAANPLQRGLGDLRSSPATTAVSEAGRSLATGRFWASDDYGFDALLMATGQPSLSGQQWVGPREEGWAVLDPLGRSRRIWNRGASYLRFEWSPGRPTRIELPGEDAILVRIDPCAPALERLGVALVVSVVALDAPCLEPKGRIPWGEVVRWVYAVRAEP